MAGKPRSQQIVKELEKQIQELEAEKRKAYKLLALHVPDLIMDELPPPLEDYSEDIPKKVIALGSQGFSEQSIIAALGCSQDDFQEWKDGFPAMAAAASRARALALAWVDDMQHEALIKGEYRFPSQTAERLRKDLQEQGSRAGDASSLVRVVRGVSAKPLDT